MKISLSAFLNTILAATLTASLVFMAVTSSSSQQYDPWVDFNEDGTIDIFDVVGVALAFGADGNPTKNVTVANWPIEVATTPWYWEPISSSQVLTSDPYDASGLGHLHMLIYAADLTALEEVDVWVYGYIQHPTIPSGKTAIEVYSITLKEHPSNYVSVTIPVPSAEFSFRVVAGESTDASIVLGFYLTWA